MGYSLVSFFRLSGMVSVYFELYYENCKLLEIELVFSQIHRILLLFNKPQNVIQERHKAMKTKYLYN